MSLRNKVIVTCAVTGVLTDPNRFNVPVTPEEMADQPRQQGLALTVHQTGI